MASLGTGSWTVAGIRATGTTAGDKAMLSFKKEGKIKIGDYKLVLASGEVPAGGVTFPGPGLFGFVRNINSVQLQSHRVPGTSGVFFDVKVSGAVDASRNFKMVAYQSIMASGSGRTSFTSGSALATTSTLASQTFYVTVEGW